MVEIKELDSSFLREYLEMRKEFEEENPHIIREVTEDDVKTFLETRDKTKSKITNFKTAILFDEKTFKAIGFMTTYFFDSIENVLFINELFLKKGHRTDEIKQKVIDDLEEFKRLKIEEIWLPRINLQGIHQFEKFFKEVKTEEVWQEFRNHFEKNLNSLAQPVYLKRDIRSQIIIA